LFCSWKKLVELIRFEVDWAFAIGLGKPKFCHGFRPRVGLNLLSKKFGADLGFGNNPAGPDPKPVSGSGLGPSSKLGSGLVLGYDWKALCKVLNGNREIG
jgi:hypothetical protein